VTEKVIGKIMTQEKFKFPEHFISPTVVVFEVTTKFYKIGKRNCGESL
jgi:hypothetical protein